jgi:acid phosphatase type 7
VITNPSLERALRWTAVLGSTVLAALVALFVVGLFSAGSDAAATTETKSLTSTVDTQIDQSSSSTNYGRATGLGVDGDVGGGSDQYALLKWDLSGIASGTRVGSASVTLNVGNPSPQTYEAYALKRPWGESQATWNDYATSKPWEVAGAKGTLDRSATVAGAITPSATGARTFTLSASVVQGWVDNPSTNHGIILADTANGDGMSFYSRESADSSLRPRLSVNLDTAAQSPPSGGDSAVLVGAGQIASSNNNDEATARLLDGIAGTVFTVGDNAYTEGTASQFTNYYAPTWGRHKARTKPSVGDHEYLTANASGYFGYYGAAAGDPKKGYYSYNLGEWHAVVLNSNCTKVGGCGATSPMVTWLKQDLAANPKACTVAYWHHQLFSSGVHGNLTTIKPIWDALYAANVDVVVNGNQHVYERFAPQDPNGQANPERGIREFVVGTGGARLASFGTVQPNSEVRNNTTFGVLKLTLHPTSYDWKFVPVAGKTFTDSGTTSCH